MSDPQNSFNYPNPSQIHTEKRIRESVDIFKNVMEERINHLAQANRRLKRKIFDLYTIFELSRRLNSVLDLDILLSDMLSSLMDELGIQNIGVFIRKDPKHDKLVLLRHNGRNPEPSAKIDECEISLTGELSRLLVSEKEPLFLREIQIRMKKDVDEIDILRALSCKLCVPLISRNQLVGILSLGSKKSNQRFLDNDLEFISVLASQITVAVENAILYENQKRINAELKATQKQLIQSEKLAAMGQLSASLAHEINNPLGIVKNYLLILSHKLAENDPNQNNLKAIKEEVDRIARIVKSLLDFSRPGKEEMFLLDLSSILKQTLFLIEKEFLKRNIEIKTRLPENLPKVLGSEDQLKQVFLNLLVNARDSMPQGGDVTICGREIDKGVEIEISDTGCGIPEENISQIFEPFFTTKEQGQGTGLGLWICYGIIQNHGGTIQAKRRKKGTSFIITLPETQSE